MGQFSVKISGLPGSHLSGNQQSNRPAMTKAYPPSWFDGRMASLKALWNDLNLSRVSAQLSLEF